MNKNNEVSIEKLPIAKYPGELDLNGFKIFCAVLEDGRRIFSERSLANAFGIKGGGAYWEKKKVGKNDSAFLPEYLSAKYLQEFIPNELRENFNSAFFYISKQGVVSKGVDVSVLPDVCDVYISAAKGKLKKNQNIYLLQSVRNLKHFSSIRIKVFFVASFNLPFSSSSLNGNILVSALVTSPPLIRSVVMVMMASGRFPVSVAN